MNKWKKHLSEQKKFFENTHKAMTIDNHSQHDKEPNYWDLLLKDVKYNPKKWEGKSALDFGCGCGRNLKNLLELANFSQVDGVDISYQNADYAKKYAVECFPSANVHTWENDGITLSDAQEDTYDFLMSHQVLQHIGNYEVRFSLLSDMYRIMKKGGILSLHFMSMDGSSYFESPDTADRNMIVGDPQYVTEDLKKIGFTEITYTPTLDFHLKRDEYYFRAVK